MLETLIKTLLKSVDIEKIQREALADPRVRQALDIAESIRTDFEIIKKQNFEILAMLDKLGMTVESLPAIENTPHEKE